MSLVVPNTSSDEETVPQQACFVAGTPVVVKEGFKRVADVKLGDVVACKSDGDPWGELYWRVVDRLFKHDPTPVLGIEIAGRLIRGTANHLYYAEGRGWIKASELRVGDQVIGHDGRLHAVTAIIDNGEVEPVYNFAVAEHHTYFVASQDGTVSALVHNTYGFGDIWAAVKEGTKVFFVDEIYGGAKALVTGEAGNAMGNRAVGIVETATGDKFTGTAGDYAQFSRAVAGDLTGVNNLAESAYGYDISNNNQLSTEERITRGAAGVAGVASTLSGGLESAARAGLSAETKVATTVGKVATAETTVADAVGAIDVAADTTAFETEAITVGGEARPIISQADTGLPFEKPIGPSNSVGTKRPGSIGGNPANRLIDVPTMAGNLTRRWVRITDVDAASYRTAQADKIGQLYNETPAGLSEAEGQAWRLQQMNEFRRQWLDDFYKNRQY